LGFRRRPPSDLQNPEFFGNVEENFKIYKNGENYEKVLEKKRKNWKRIREREKRGLQYIDDMDEEGDPFFKVEKVYNSNEDKDNFLSILNKQPPNNANEVKKEDNMISIHNDNEEEDKDNFLSILNKPKEDANTDNIYINFFHVLV